LQQSLAFRFCHQERKIAARVQAARDEGAGLPVLLSIMALVMM
jgi:hypothetical protein